MENERTLAYSMARELTEEELKQVSGGAAQTSGTGTFEVIYTKDGRSEVVADVTHRF